MLRRLLTLLSILSLVLCAATAVLWVRSYGKRDAIAFQHRGTWWEIASEQGRVLLDNELQLTMEHEQILLEIKEADAEMSRRRF